MTLLPYLVAFIAGAVGWSLGRKIEGVFLASVLSLLGSILGFYYARKYIKGINEMMGR